MSDAEKKYPDCWLFDHNRRRYRKDKNGRECGNPIWREHWWKVKIVGETSRSWISAYGHKIPKKGGRDCAFSEEDIENAAFIQSSYIISDYIRMCKDYEKLKAVADILGCTQKVISHAKGLSDNDITV